MKKMHALTKITGWMAACKKSGKPDQWEGYKTALNPPTLLQRAIPPFVKFQLNAIYKD
jgi:hypothetical protein